MNIQKYVFIMILALVFVSFSKLSYCQSSIDIRGVYRFQTQTDFNNYWNGSGQSIDAMDGVVYTTDAIIGLAVWINNAQDGEVFTWDFIRPDGSLKSSVNFKYDRNTDCWARNLFPYCGDPSNPILKNIGWIVGTSILNEMPGFWTVNFLDNGILKYTRQFELVGRELKIVSGNEQTGLPGDSFLEPLLVKVLDFDKTGLPDSQVIFNITEQPNVAKGAGLTSGYNSPPLHTSITSLTTTTDSNGMAFVYIEIGNKEGAYTITATSSDADIGTPQDFTQYARKLLVGDLEMRAINDVGIPNVPDPFFIAHFDPNGNIIEYVNDSIGEMVNDNFNLEINLNAFPHNPDWVPNTKWKWQIMGLGGPTNGPSFTSWWTVESITPEVNNPGPRYFGDHDMKLNFSFYDDTGSRINTQKTTLNLKLFFEKHGDDNGDAIPNWFEYWQSDNVVSGMERFEYQPDPNLTMYGSFIIPGLLELGPFASEELTAFTINGITFGGIKGINTVASVVAHEIFHDTVYRNKYGGSWEELPNSDDDNLPDEYELQIGTDPSKNDTFKLATRDGFSHAADYLANNGDEEYTALLAGKGEVGVALKDWANPGKQTDPHY